MRYLVVDASLHGTGIRDKYNGGYVSPSDLGLSSKIIEKITQWLLQYENEHYNGYINERNIDKLDREGKEIASIIKSELREVNMAYFSDARMTVEIV